MMWQLDPDQRARLRSAAFADQDRDAAIALCLLLDSDADLEVATRLRWCDLAPDGRLSVATKGRVALGPDLIQLLEPRRDQPERPLFPHLRTIAEKRVVPLLARIGPDAGVHEVPVHQEASTSEAASMRMTRDCLDPWEYLEIAASGAAKPCCVIPTIATIRDEGVAEGRDPNRLALQQELLTGRLRSFCQSCHIRRMVPLEHLRRKVQQLQQREQRFPVQLRAELTSNCNLRCRYCAVSSPCYEGVDMTQDALERILDIAGSLPRGSAVMVNGHGETTIHPQWVGFCSALVEMGLRLEIITNLAKTFSADEIALLARFSSIQISLDSADADQTRRIRKAVTPDRIATNMDRIRAARGAHRPSPVFSLSVGLYDPSVWTLTGLLDWAFRQDIRIFIFWNLVEYDHHQGLRGLSGLDKDETARARDIIYAVHDRLTAEGCRFRFAGDFIAGDGDSFLPPDSPA